MKKSFLISIIVSLILLIGGTFAWAVLRMNRTALVLTVGNTNTIRIKIKPYQMNGTMYQVNTYNDSSVTPIEVEVINSLSSSSIIGLYFKINSISDALLSEGFKYAIEKSTDGTNYTLCTTCGGNFENALDSNRMYILEESVPTGNTYYKVYIYMDGLCENDEPCENAANMAGASVEMELRGALELSGTDYVKTLYTVANQDSIVQVSHNAISAANSATGSDIAATTDYRYKGTDPNNYICLDFAGSSTCPSKHLYRIIGIIRNDYNGKMELKVVKASSLVDDSSTSQFAWDSNGSNNWPDSSLLSVLNTEYLNSSGNFTSNGLSAKVKRMISTSRYYLGAFDLNASSVNDYYVLERGNSVPSGNANVWDGYIGLTYTTDYGYAYGSNCGYERDFVGDSCESNNWLMLDNWFITPQYSNSNRSYSFDTSFTSTNVDSTLSILPTFSLNSGVNIIGGLGTSANPYKVSYMPYTEEILNGSDPVLSAGLIPIKFDEGSTGAAGTFRVADINDEWYNYENKQWANAVLVKTSGVNTREYYQTHPNTVFDSTNISDILAYFVWIPRYSYQTWILSGVDTSGPHSISIEFASKNTKKYPKRVGEYYTSPAFTFGTTEVSGFWFGKFETAHTLSIDSNCGGSSACSTGCTNATCAQADNVRILPNVISLRYLKVSQYYYTMRSMARAGNNLGLDNTSINSHMATNREWGAVAYLSHSIYGINAQIRQNNSSSFKTGCGAAAATTGGVTGCTNAYANTVTVFPQSTTGNVTGIFDMAGGCLEYVMGNWNRTNSSGGLTLSGFTTTTYLDVYPNPPFAGTSIAVNNESCTLEYCGGHALTETYNWYTAAGNMVTSANPWMSRGGRYDGKKTANQFAYNGSSGGNGISSTTSRTTLTPTT